MERKPRDAVARRVVPATSVKAVHCRGVPAGVLLADERGVVELVGVQLVVGFADIARRYGELAECRD